MSHENPRHAEFPALPQTEPDPERRRARLAGERATYELDFTYHGLPFAKRYADLPLRDRQDVRYNIKRAELKATLGANFVAQKAGDILEVPHGEDRTLHMAQKVLESVAKAFGKTPAFSRYNKPEPTRDVARSRTPLTYHDYIDLYRIIVPPAMHVHWEGHPPPGLTDQAFANQRVAGTNPVLLEQVRERMPDNFPVTDAHLARALNALGEDPVTLAAALAQGRLYLVDMSILDGLSTTNALGTGLKQYLWAPMSLFLSVERRGCPQRPLVPIAIQLGQSPGGGTKIYTPVRPEDDAEAACRWAMAKLAVQSCDSNHHGIVMHNAQCHLMLSRIVISTRRALAPNHPVRILLEPHFQGTLRVVNEGTRDLVEPGGFTPLLQSVDLNGVFELLHRSFERHDWDYFNPRVCYARRGVDDPELEYPFRDDRLRILRHIDDFVESYLGLYYHDNEEVALDTELSAWMEELEAGGKIRGIRRPLHSISALRDLVGEIIDRTSLLHTAINYSVFDLMSFPPNMPAAIYGPGPDDLASVTEADLRRMLPTKDNANLQLADTFFVQNMLLDPLGAYKNAQFADGRVAALIDRFRRVLADEELLIGRDNSRRTATYEILLPSRLSTSILV
jgi:arachidonate 15-lipoxygenase